MSTLCELLTEHWVDARNPNLYRVELVLKNSDLTDETFSWVMRFPKELRIVAPHRPASGDAVIRAKSEESVVSWLADISGIPEPLRPTVMPTLLIRAEISTSNGLSGLCEAAPGLSR